MKNRKEYIILILIIVLVSTYLVFQKKGEIHYALPAIAPIEEESVTELRITQGYSTMSLIKNNDRWLIYPQQYPADTSQVEEMIEAVAAMRLTVLASESESYGIYELDKEHAITVELYGTDGILRKVDIGKTASSYRHTFVRLDGDKRVYHAEGNLKNTFTKKVETLRDKVVLAFNEAITEITLIKDKDKITIIRASAPLSQEPASKQDTPVMWQTVDGSPINNEAVDEMIRTLGKLQCDGFAEDKTKEDFSSPLYTISLTGEKTYTLSLFEKEDEKYPAISSENEYPFFISTWKAEKIMKDPYDLVDARNDAS